MMNAIDVRNLGKAYKIYPNRFSRLKEWLFPSISNFTQKWVLRNINFSIPCGQALGVIGVNGAGKSTLLKIITRTAQPTEGSIEVNGRVVALLELGTGFHPDFTGRQNVFMSGQLHGLTADVIDSLLPEIESFAGIGAYLDLPVRIYSSGMQVRLAFAVATAVRPDIFIIDEAMAVGDAAFQRKCFRRIEEFRRLGTTLLLVSHDVETIKKFCGTAMYLRGGAIAALGPAKGVCDLYEKDLFGGIKQNTPLIAKKSVESALNYDRNLISECEITYGDGRAVIENIWLEDSMGDRANVFGSKEVINLKYQVRFSQTVKNIVFAFMIKTKDGIALFGADTSADDEILSKEFSPEGPIILSFRLGNAFAPGNYYLNCGVRHDDANKTTFLHRRVDALIFRVRPTDENFVKSGIINTSLEYSIESL